MKKILAILILLNTIWLLAPAQYFGQNKTTYKDFDFKLYKTPHFELYHYFENKRVVTYLGELAEKWYYYHQQVLLDTFHTRNTLIFYSSHGDFQQTTAIGSQIDVGTGGITEGLKRRVVMPVTFSHHQTDHVLGHELVHAFQYHMLETDPEISLMSIGNIPLWMIEGMAEFLSIGSVDCQTNLWMRDALIHERFPSLKDMTYNYGFSPYRFGHSFWAFIACRYGEQYIPRLFKATARNGYEQAIADVLMISTDSLSRVWEQTLRQHLVHSAVDSTFSIVGDRLLSRKNSGRYNLNPSLSPDGQHIVFLSERNFYGIDLFMANAQTGVVESRLYTATGHDEIDALNYLETSGTWSPDGKYFAFIAFAKGKSSCLMFDIEKHEIIEELHFDEIDEICWPAWSPYGEEIAFVGLKEGKSDIYVYHFSKEQLINVTQNHYACMQPSWSDDGKSLLYSTDEPTDKHILNARGNYNIARVDKNGNNQCVYETFEGARNLNPVDTGSEILFLSDYDGRRNLYALDSSDGRVYKITNYPTGITGMTEFSPALTIAGQTLCYTIKWDGEFPVYKTNLAFVRHQKKEVTQRHIDPGALRIVPFSPIPSQIETNLYFNRQPYSTNVDSFYNDDIRHKFKLDYLGNVQGGIMTGRFGTGMAGSIEAMFSDILGQNKLYTALSINGEIYDFGGQVAYINQRKRVKLGTSLSHIPYCYGTYSYETITHNDGSNSQSLNYIFRRTFEDKASVFTFIPVNKTRRFELGASYAYYSYRIERLKYVDSFNQFYAEGKERLPSPPGFGTGILDAAYVIDNAKMGLASPVEGKRFRVQVQYYLHKLKMQTLLVDFRKYFFIKPYSIAFRLYHYGRYGQDADNDRMTELFLGSPWFIRGYDSGGFYGNELQDGNVIGIDQLVGSRMLVSNLEWRIPFTGPRKLAMLPSGFLFSELALFVDGGICWSKQNHPVWSLTNNTANKRIPIFSGGLAYRINIFGAMVIEPFYAFPFYQGHFKKGKFGMNILAGW